MRRIVVSQLSEALSPHKKDMWNHRRKWLMPNIAQYAEYKERTLRKRKTSGTAATTPKTIDAAKCHSADTDTQNGKAHTTTAVSVSPPLLFFSGMS